MLTQSKIKDFLAGNLSDGSAHEYLLSISNKALDVSVITEFVDILKEINSPLIDNLVSGSSVGPVADLIDCSGTGGSGMPHYNTSTTVAFVLAAGGLKVAKFGNRAASGRSGSFDFLDAINMPIVLQNQYLLEILQNTNLVFLYARQFYPTLAKFTSLRQAIGRATVFNLIGPLLHPLNPALQIIGTTSTETQELLAHYIALRNGNKKTFVMHADSGMDELDPCAGNTIVEINKSERSASVLRWHGHEMRPLATNLGPKENALIFNKIIRASTFPSYYFRSLVTVNAAAGFLVAGKVKSLEEGKQFAESLLASGAVLDKYEQCRRIYAQYIG